jgi:zinc finger protein
MAPQSIAKDIFADMGRKVSELSLQQKESADTEAKVVEEIESLCMNCHENVCIFRTLL